MQRATPPILGSTTTFPDVAGQRIIVPTGSGAAYRTAPIWSEFAARIVEPVNFANQTALTVRNGVNNANHRTIPAATGGSGTFSYSISGLPAGLSFNTSTRVISGTPNATVGNHTVTVTATPTNTTAAGMAESRQFAITVEPQTHTITPTTGTFTGGSWVAAPAPVNHNSHVDVTIILNEGFRHHPNTAITVNRTGGGNAPVSHSGNAGDTTRVFRINNVQAPITAISVDNLERINLDNLSTLIAIVQGLEAAVYYNNANWSNLQTQLGFAIAVRDGHTFNQTQVNQARADLYNAFNAINPIPTTDALEDYIESVEAMQHLFTSSSWEDFDYFLDLARDTLSGQPSQQDVNDMLETLTEEFNNLVYRGDTNYLAELITKIENLDPELYYNTNWGNLQTELGNATIVRDSDDKDQTQVNNAYTALHDAFNSINPIPTVTALENYILEVELLENNYTPASWADFETLLDQARDTVNLEGEPTQQDVNTMLATLTEAFGKLANKSQLEIEIGETKTFLEDDDFTTLIEIDNDDGFYTDESWADFLEKLSDLETALEEAERMLEEAVTQSEIDEARNALQDALTELLFALDNLVQSPVPCPDCDELECVCQPPLVPCKDCDKITCECTTPDSPTRNNDVGMISIGVMLLVLAIVIFISLLVASRKQKKLCAKRLESIPNS
jgi:hypothetical protein